MRGDGPAKGTLYVRIPAGVKVRLAAAAGEDNATLSATAARVLERGLDYDHQAVMALLGWCWQMAGYMRTRDPETAASFADAIKRAEVALHVRKAEG